MTAGSPFLHSLPLEARFDSDCGECGGQIEAGDMIVMADREAVHVGCFDHGECPENATCD